MIASSLSTEESATSFATSKGVIVANKSNIGVVLTDEHIIDFSSRAGHDEVVCNVELLLGSGMIAHFLEEKITLLSIPSICLEGTAKGTKHNL